MEYITKSGERFKSLESTMSNLVTLMYQRTPGTLPSQTEANPKNEEVNVMSTRSGKSKAEPKKKEKTTLTLGKWLSSRKVMKQKKGWERGTDTFLGKCSFSYKAKRWAEG